MTRGSALNEKQRAVLRWVADGCPDGVFEGFDHRVSAAALRNRGLIRVSGRGSTWTAELTERGRYHLDNPPTERTPRTQEPDETKANLKANQPAPQPKPLSPTEQLIADLGASEEGLRVRAWPKKGERDYRQLVASAQRFDKVPIGKRITLVQDRDELQIRLEDAIEGTLVDLLPVPVPRRLTRPHIMAARFRDDTEHHEVSRAQLGRATRIAHAIATTAEQRGMTIATVEAKKNEYGHAKWSGGNDGHIAIEIRGHRYKLRVAEEKVPARGRWEAEQRWRSPYGQRRVVGRYDANGTGRLTISLLAGYSRSGRATSWSDRNNWTLEDKLPALMRELEVRAAEDDHAKLETERAAQERQRLWEIEIERARERFMESHRANVLREQIAAWQEARLFTRYLDALTEAHGNDEEAAEWISWVDKYIRRLDPLGKLQGMPEQPEISREELRPFMPRGMSPYGPSGW